MPQTQPQLAPAAALTSPPVVALALNSKTLDEHYHRARDSECLEVKEDFFAEYNDNWADKLHGEHEVMEFFAKKLVYMYARDGKEHGQEFAVHIRYDAFGTTVKGYAQRYKLVRQFLNKEPGKSLRAWLLQPANSADADARSMLIFQGTSPEGTMDGLCRKNHYPVGWGNDFDPDGIGARSHRANGKSLIDAVEEEQKLRDVTLAGHSLGGAQLTHLLAALSEAQQKRCRAYTFGSPGVPYQVAMKVRPQGIMWHFRTRHDAITKAGSAHALGVIIKLREVDSRWLLGITPNHTTAQMAFAAIDGHVIQFFPRLPQLSDTHLAVEAGRYTVYTLISAAGGLISMVTSHLPHPPEQDATMTLETTLRS